MNAMGPFHKFNRRHGIRYRGVMAVPVARRESDPPELFTLLRWKECSMGFRYPITMLLIVVFLIVEALLGVTGP